MAQVMVKVTIIGGGEAESRRVAAPDKRSLIAMPTFKTTTFSP